MSGCGKLTRRNPCSSHKYVLFIFHRLYTRFLVSRSFQPTKPKKFDTNIGRTEWKKKIRHNFWITLVSLFFTFHRNPLQYLVPQQSISCMRKCGFVIEFLYFFFDSWWTSRFYSRQWRIWMEFVFFFCYCCVEKANTKWKWHVWWNVIYLS